MSVPNWYRTCFLRAVSAMQMRLPKRARGNRFQRREAQSSLRGVELKSWGSNSVKGHLRLQSVDARTYAPVRTIAGHLPTVGIQERATSTQRAHSFPIGILKAAFASRNWDPHRRRSISCCHNAGRQARPTLPAGSMPAGTQRRGVPQVEFLRVRRPPTFLSTLRRGSSS